MHTPTRSSAQRPTARSFCPVVHDSGGVYARGGLQQSGAQRCYRRNYRGQRILDLLPLRGDEENCRDAELELVLQEPLARVHARARACRSMKDDDFNVKGSSPSFED